MPRIIHFEIPVDDAPRASAFYEQTFGWTVQRWDGPSVYWLVSTGPKAQPGIDGALIGRSDLHKTPVNIVEVESIETFAKKITEHGGTMISPKHTIPGVGFSAYCKDTEGNVFGIFQPAASSIGSVTSCGPRRFFHSIADRAKHLSTTHVDFRAISRESSGECLRIPVGACR